MMYVQKITKSKSTIGRFMSVTILSVLPLMFIIEDMLLYGVMISASLLLAYAILRYAVIRVEVDSDGIYKHFNLIPRSRNKLVSAGDITEVECREDENAQKSNEYSFSDDVIPMDVEGSVHIHSESGNKIVVSSESPQDLTDAINEIRNEPSN